MDIVDDTSKELDQKHAMHKALGLPKYDESTIIGYAQYLKRCGFPDEEIQKIIEDIRKE